MTHWPQGRLLPALRVVISVTPMIKPRRRTDRDLRRGKNNVFDLFAAGNHLRFGLLGNLFAGKQVAGVGGSGMSWIIVENFMRLHTGKFGLRVSQQIRNHLIGVHEFPLQSHEHALGGGFNQGTVFFF